MELTRIYYNASGDTLRIDKVSIDITPPNYKELRAGNDPGLQMCLGPQKVNATNITSSTVLAGSRVIANIELIGDFDAYDETGPQYDIKWATKTLGNDQVVRFDMSNLPGVTETI